MSGIRFELKDIPDGIREISLAEKYIISEVISASLEFAHMGDELVPDRKILTIKNGVTARALGGTLGIGGERSGRWTEDDFDRFFSQSFRDGCYLWVEPDDTPETLKPIYWAPYSSARRDWLYMHSKIENSGLPCGMTGASGDLSVFSENDSDFTIVFGDKETIARFDASFGGKELLLKEFEEYLHAREVDFGEGNIYGFLKQYVYPLVKDST